MDEAGDSATAPIQIPYSDLSAAALRGVVEQFVLREGTDYGTHVYSLDEKVEQVLAQLRAGRAQIVFDPKTETVDIVAEAGNA
jgi:uncharacterized protein YheU (UPF0270 family)